MPLTHIHQLNLIAFIDVVKLGHGHYSIWEILIHTEGQVPAAVHVHKCDVFVPGVGRLHLEVLQKLVGPNVPRRVEEEKYRILLFVVKKVKDLLLCFEFYNFVVKQLF